MSDPTQRPAEQALRDYAEQRRAQSPPTELHPATRRLLQGEVARTHDVKNAPAPRAAAVPWLATWWGRLALGAPALAAIVVVLIVLNREREMHLALSTDTAPTAFQELEAAGKPAPAPTIAEPAIPALVAAAGEKRLMKSGADTLVVAADAKSETAVGLDDMRRQQVAETPVPDRSLRGASLESLSLNPSGAPEGTFSSTGQITLAGTARTFGGFAAPADKDAAAAPAAPMPTATAPAKRDDYSLANQFAERETNKQMARAEPPPPSPAAAPADSSNIASAAGLAFSKLGAAYSAPVGQVLNRQQFTQSEDRAALRRNFNSPAPSPVLNSFQFENAGYAVQITDADGSVYSGQIVGLTDANELPKDKSEAAAKSQRAPETTAGRFVQPSASVGGFAGNASQLQQTPAAQTIFFRVQGTNRTLQQAVEFEGNLLLPATANLQDPRAGQNQSAPTQGLLQQGQIQGRAIIGGRTQLDVRAGATP